MNLLQHIQILDFTRLLPGPVATHLLAQMGAQVIKVESPKRIDYARTMGPQIDGASHLYHQLNHNKKLESIDYTTPKGKAIIEKYIQTTDVLIEQFRPGAMAAWQLDYGTVKQMNPNIIYVSLTGYGQKGMLSQEAGHDLNYLAYAGMMSMLKDEQGKPVVPDVQFADISGAYMAVMAIQAALLNRYQTGKGSFVDVALCDAVMPFLTIPYSLHSGGLDPKYFNVINGKTTVNYTVYQCADDKWLSVGALEIKFWNNLCEAIGKTDWKRKNQMELMTAVFPKAQVEALFKSKTRAAWLALLEGKDVCVAPILELAELEQSPYHQEKKSFETFATPNGKSVKTIALPFRVVGNAVSEEAISEEAKKRRSC